MTSPTSTSTKGHGRSASSRQTSVVDEPGGGEQPDRDQDRLPRLEVGDGRVDQAQPRVRVVDDAEEREPGQPRPVRLPLVPVQRLGQVRRRDPELLDPVEAAAVDLPRLAARRPRRGPLPARARAGGCRARRSRTRCRSRRSPWWRGTSGRRGRASRWRTTLGAAPPVLRDRDELLHGRVQLLGAGAVDPRAQHLEDLRLRPPVDEDDEAEAEPLLVLGVQPRELGERLGVGVRPLLGGGARGQAAARARSPGGRSVPRASPPRSAWRSPRGRSPSGSSRRGEPRTSAVSPSNSSASWASAQLPR